jgi:hypothetical protein
MVEFVVVSALICELLSSPSQIPPPIPEPYCEHRASICELTTESIPIDEFPPEYAYPVPIPEPDELDALMVEFVIVSALICELMFSPEQ